MHRIAIAGAALAGSVALLAIGFWAGQRTSNEESSRYLFDVTSHMTLSCANEHIVALTDVREGRTDDAVRGLELLVAARLANLDITRIRETAIAKKSFSDLRGPLSVYQEKFRSPILDAKQNPRLANILGSGQ
jgi:hypothetical protein